MPDHGDIKPPASASHGWRDAMTALPLEAPDPGGWQRLQARLPTKSSARKSRWPIWLATAASLAVAATIPIWMVDRQSAVATAPQIVEAPPTSSPIHAPIADAPDRPVGPAPKPAESASTELAGHTPALPPVTPRASEAPGSRPARATSRTARTNVATADEAVRRELDTLYARSAQLEQLLAFARDERVAYGTSAAMSDVLGARIASIDAALIQDQIQPNQRAQLWGARVDTLQQLVGIEATQRLNAAHGENYQAALVTID